MRLKRIPSMLGAYSARIFAILVRREFKRFEGTGVSHDPFASLEDQPYGMRRR